YRSDDLGEHWVFKHEGMIKVQKESAMSLGVNGILIDPSDPARLFAATTQGLFKSINGANSWTLEGSEIGPTFMIGVVLDRKSGAIYAGTNSGFFKSTDGGHRWVPKNEGMKNPVVRAIAVDPKHSGVLFIGTQDGLYKSIDAGERWRLLHGYK
ncbi:MAG TPA: hypothetical protein VN944_02250, partial [Nitrospiria bacterium]|nr:hypothetical protein [Nitrospiria bacterium]